MSQAFLFADLDTVPSPICAYDRPCPRKGRAQLGPVERVSADCENQSVLCLTCGRTGTRSTNLAAKGKRA